ncbi:hypothetical protein C2E23DRAFT_888863 [Lenzites betulinus]|nr:hypothetical protein C2E23DRAFT_888863 [Lenzites betulinus]
MALVLQRILLLESRYDAHGYREPSINLPVLGPRQDICRGERDQIQDQTSLALRRLRHASNFTSNYTRVYAAPNTSISAVVSVPSAASSTTTNLAISEISAILTATASLETPSAISTTTVSVIARVAVIVTSVIFLMSVCTALYFACRRQGHGRAPSSRPTAYDGPRACVDQQLEYALRALQPPPASHIAACTYQRAHPISTIKNGSWQHSRPPTYCSADHIPASVTSCGGTHCNHGVAVVSRADAETMESYDGMLDAETVGSSAAVIDSCLYIA